jgi:hypothetical protein
MLISTSSSGPSKLGEEATFAGGRPSVRRKEHRSAGLARPDAPSLLPSLELGALYPEPTAEAGGA